jgi:hypothetical protein
LCSTHMELRGLKSLDGVVLDTADHPIYRALVNSFRELTHQSHRSRHSVQLPAV